MEYRVSVIIPVYNCESYLERAVRSVINQPDFESVQLILVDDGSKDGSGALCDKFAAQYENVMALHQQNSGVSVARNNGIDHAEGQWIAFLDSDDYYLEGFFKKMLSAPQADLICCAYTWNIEKSPELNSMFENKVYTKDEFSTSLYPVMSNDYIFFQCWNKLYKRSIVEEFDIRFPAGVKYAEDMQFVYNYVKYIDSFRFVSEPLYYYYVNENNATNVVKKGYETYEMIFLFLTSYFEWAGYSAKDLLKNYIYHSLGAIYTSAVKLNMFSAYFYIKNILKNTMFFKTYSDNRVYQGADGVNGYFDRFIMLKSPLLIILLAHANEFNMKRLQKRGNKNG